MTERVSITSLHAHVGSEVRLDGWLHNKRSSGKLQFLIVRDGSAFAQAVMAKASVPPEDWADKEAEMAAVFDDFLKRAQRKAA